MGQPTNGPAIPLASTAIPSGSQFTMPAGAGNVTITHTIAPEASMAMRVQNTSMSNGTAPGYTWATVDSIGSSPLVNPLYRNYTVTYTFSPAIPAHTLVLGVSGLGRSSDAGGSGPAESNVKVEANGSTSALNWQMIADYELPGSNPGATELRNATNTGAAVAGSPLLLRNSQIAAGGINPHWNTKFAVVLMNQAVSSLTLTVNHVRGDGFSLAVGTVDESCWIADRDMVANEAMTATEAQNPNAVVPQWSYGYRGDIASAAITPFTAAQHVNITTGSNAGIEGFNANIGSSTPSVWVNATANPIVRSGLLNLDPGHLEVHPGPDGKANDVVVVRWTAPTAGLYEITASWRDNDPSSGNGAIGAIVRNGTTLFSQAWSNGGAAVSHHIPSVTLSAGEKIDFVVDANGDYYYDSTDLFAEVCLIGSPEIGITDNGATPAANLVDNVTPVNFDCIAVNTSNVRNLLLRNDGTGILTVTSVTKTGLNAADFTVSPSLATASVLPGTPFPFTITFTPTTTGLKNAVIHITSNDANGDETIFDIPVTGCGCMPEISIYSQLAGNWLTDNVGGIKFGNVATCGSAQDHIYIFNEGCDCDLHISAWTITGPNASEFHLINPPSLPVTVPSGPLVLDVEFAPTSPGNKTAVLHVVSDDGDETSFEIGLFGAAAGPNINVTRVSPASTLIHNGTINLGCVMAGTSAFAVKVTNNGSGGSTLHVGQPTVAPSGVISITPSWTSPVSLTGSASGTINVGVQAGAPSGAFSADISIPSDHCNETPFIVHVIGFVATSMGLPTVTTQPNHQIAYLCGPASFTAAVTSGCPYTVQWQRTPTPSSNSFSNITGNVSATTTTFTIPETKTTDATKYRMQIAGGPASNPAQLTLVNPANNVLVSTSTPGAITFTCNAWNAVNYKWKKFQFIGPAFDGINNGNTNAFDPGTTFAGAGTSSLTISTRTANAAGWYFCEVEGWGGVKLNSSAFALLNNAGLPATAAGDYVALVERCPDNQGLGGKVNLHITATGVVTGTVTMGATTYPLQPSSGITYSNNTLSNIWRGYSYVADQDIYVQWVFDPATNRFVTDPGVPTGVSKCGNTSCAITGWKKIAPPTPIAPTTPITGRYHFTLDTPATATNPQGYTWGYFTVATTGDYVIQGRTACDEAFTCQAFISPGTAPSNKYEIALFSIQPSGSSLLGTCEIVPGTPNLLQNSAAPITWSRPVSASAIYGAGFNALAMTTEGGRYIPATPRVIGVPTGANNAQVNFTDGGLPSAWNPDRICTILGANFSLAPVGNEQTKFTVTGSTGLITAGSFKLLDPSPYAPTGGLIARQTTFTGIVIPLAAGGQEGRGYFMLDKLPSYFGEPPSKLSGAVRLH